VCVPGKPFQSSLMFAGKAGAYLSEAPFRYAPGLKYKHKTRLERPDWDKHAGLLQTFVNDRSKKFHNIGPKSSPIIRMIPRSLEEVS